MMLAARAEYHPIVRVGDVVLAVAGFDRALVEDHVGELRRCQAGVGTEPLLLLCRQQRIVTVDLERVDDRIRRGLRRARIAHEHRAAVEIEMGVELPMREAAQVVAVVGQVQIVQRIEIVLRAICRQDARRAGGIDVSRCGEARLGAVVAGEGAVGDRGRPGGAAIEGDHARRAIDTLTLRGAGRRQPARKGGERVLAEAALPVRYLVEVGIADIERHVARVFAAAEIAAPDQRGVVAGAVAGARDASLTVDLKATEVLLHDEVDHSGDGIGTVCG